MFPGTCSAGKQVAGCLRELFAGNVRETCGKNKHKRTGRFAYSQSLGACCPPGGTNSPPSKNPSAPLAVVLMYPMIWV